MVLVIFLYIFVETVMLCLVIFLDNFEHKFSDQLAWLTLAFVAAYVSIIGYLYIYYSGTPYKNQTYATMMKKLLVIFSVWSLCQLPRPILTLSKVDAYPLDKDNLNAP